MRGHLESQLNDFSFEKRKAALLQLLKLAEENPAMLPPEGNHVNMHCHSFYSFNAYGYSPSALVWLAKQLGWQVAGIVDFDNLDGVDEFLSGCDLASVRGSAAMETRIFISEFAEYVANSPGEPGVSYSCGIGFSSGKVNEKGKKILKSMRERADQRNRSMVEHLNDYLDPVCIDYEEDVIPLTPSGNATERHMLSAYLDAASRVFPDPAPFWADKMGLKESEVRELMQDLALFSDAVRRKLMKQGGIAYVQPGPKTFPPAEEFYEMVISNNAIPSFNYLNGATEGEQRMEELLELLIAKGIAAFNMIPNLAVPDPQSDPDNYEIRKKRAELLKKNADLARDFDLPLHIGTEMNSYGQRKEDDLSTEELAPLQKHFIDGAYFIYGHVQLQRTLGIGYQSAWAKSFMPTRAERNRFYTKAGYLIPPGFKSMETLKSLDGSMNPPDLLKKLEA